MIINFQVTYKIIDDSKGGCPENCVVANLISEVLNSDHTVRVSHATVAIYTPRVLKRPRETDHRLVQLLMSGDSLYSFIMQFDNYKKSGGTGLRPALISFQLDIREECLTAEVVESIKNSGVDGATTIVAAYEAVHIPLQPYFIEASVSELVTCTQ